MMTNKQLYHMALLATFRNDSLVSYQEYERYTAALYHALKWGQEMSQRSKRAKQEKED